jgi:hypothetical protein
MFVLFGLLIAIGRGRRGAEEKGSSSAMMWSLSLLGLTHVEDVPMRH